MKISNAIISVCDKTDLVSFAEKLISYKINIYSTGGTYQTLKKAGIKATSIATYTGFPEILSGRVKSLHPKIHAGILARRDMPEDMKSLKENDIITFDLVCINLYPFQELIEKEGIINWTQEPFIAKAIEMIDIGGPTMLRAAAKNHEYVCVLDNPAQYPRFLSEMKKTDGRPSLEYRRSLAEGVFKNISSYDSMVQFFFSNIQDPKEPEYRNIRVRRDMKLRYGENPHQEAGFYRLTHSDEKCWKQLHGKELSYNNLLDLDAALDLAFDFDEPICAVFKHTNPCGVASDPSCKEALKKAIDSDPVSCFGGIVIFNRKLMPQAVAKLQEIFFELIIAPEFDRKALKALKKKKNVRLIQYKPDAKRFPDKILSSADGFLIQDIDDMVLDESALKCVSKKQPTQADIQELKFAWTLVKHIKSNAVVFTRNKQSLGVGAGQMSRIDSVNIAIQKAEQASLALENSYFASDAFFPFKDTVEMVAKKNIKAIIQPGGSVRDQESIEAADEAEIIMLFTGMRHFRH